MNEALPKSAMTDQAKLRRHVFFHHYENKRKELEERGLKLAHYTSAETAYKIIHNKELWMRSTGVMNDYSEVKHGLDCLEKAMGSKSGARFKNALNAAFQGLADDVLGRFNQWIPRIAVDTFVTCFSEHISKEDDEYGRLSMWRAYGGESGAAIIFNPQPFLSEADVLNVYMSPVAYLNDEGISNELEEMAERIDKNLEGVIALDIEKVRDAVFAALRFAVICTKHPAFKEEREWRAIASPSFMSNESWKHVAKSIEIVGGVPQPILHVGLREYPGTELPSLAPSELIERILIGPCASPQTVRRSLIETLRSSGHPALDKDIHDTQIPLRPNLR